MAIRPRADLRLKRKLFPYKCRFGHVTTGEGKWGNQRQRAIVCIICRRLAGTRALTRLPGRRKLSYDTIKPVEMATRAYDEQVCSI